MKHDDGLDEDYATEAAELEEQLLAGLDTLLPEMVRLVSERILVPSDPVADHQRMTAFFNNLQTVLTTRTRMRMNRIVREGLAAIDAAAES